MSRPAPTPARRRVYRVTGQVQGVGFRPFVYRLARELGLVGTVRNDPAGVTVEAQGEPPSLDAFRRRVESDAPDLARVDGVRLVSEAEPVAGERAFAIVASGHGAAARGRVTVDAGVCADCLREMRDPSNRRHRHALINCTNCGPRYTIVEDLPYDRPLTTMAPFAMCEACEHEYRDPADRRFHAQPTCCPDCGPRLGLLDGSGREVEGDAIDEAAALLRAGRVLAMKGLGGYHLVVDATNEEAVSDLRRRKKRDHKPFALMVVDLAAARGLVDLSPAAAARLVSPARPIVIAPRRSASGAVAAEVAPGCHRLGVMLPYTPMQHLLFEAGLGPLVMTSANHADDPLLKDDGAVRDHLGALCDGTLLHDRAIERAVDDSIFLDAPCGVVPVRRARGYAPAPLPLPVPAPDPGLCVGGELKGTVAVVRGTEAVLSQHLGDLTYTLAYRRFERTAEDLERLFDVTPQWIACDAHPGYLSRRYAYERGARVVEVQHHHAHLASLLAEHGRTERILGLICDGVGYGLDGAAWGGEVLAGDLESFDRLGHLRPLRLPGGDAAARETGRPALSWMVDLLGDAAAAHPVAARVVPDSGRRTQLLGLLAADVNCPPSSGMGRLFDAAASLLGLCDFNHHEAMSGMRLETAARTGGPSGTGLVALVESADGLELDTRPLLDALLGQIEGGVPASESAYTFHDALADALVRAAARAAEWTGLLEVGLSGGVFLNGLFTEGVARGLEARGLVPLLHARVPPNDGGIAYGQAAVAAARLAAGV